ncbi:MAG TPA: hypothetical protein VFI47_27470 [Acidimicrobiales bacterium]|nr:hypothetical protein [Acidimicrobiales bacterium]
MPSNESTYDHTAGDAHGDDTPGGDWRSSGVLAWTEHDGPGRPPRAPGRGLSFALAATLGVILAGMLSTDTLCPDHRNWVLALGTAGLVGTVVAITGLVKGWAVAPYLTLAVSFTGISIGLIDAIHDPTRGRLIALGFGACAALAAVLAGGTVPLALWDRRVRRDARPDAAPRRAATLAASDARPAVATPVDTPVDAAVDTPVDTEVDTAVDTVADDARDGALTRRE